MDYETVFKLGEPYLKKNDFWITHTRRVFDLVKQNFEVPQELEELVFCSIIMHDIGGSSIETIQRRTNNSRVSSTELGYNESFIQEVCQIVRTHHDHPSNPSLAFKILYDSDKLVMFSPEEFPYYNSKPNFNWNEIVDLIYHEHARDFAKKLLTQRKTEETNLTARRLLISTNFLSDA